MLQEQVRAVQLQRPRLKQTQQNQLEKLFGQESTADSIRGEGVGDGREQFGQLGGWQSVSETPGSTTGYMIDGRDFGIVVLSNGEGGNKRRRMIFKRQIHKLRYGSQNAAL